MQLVDDGLDEWLVHMRGISDREHFLGAGSVDDDIRVGEDGRRDR